MGTCALCGQEAETKLSVNKDNTIVKCPNCGEYRISGRGTSLLDKHPDWKEIVTKQMKTYAEAGRKMILTRERILQIVDENIVRERVV